MTNKNDKLINFDNFDIYLCPLLHSDNENDVKSLIYLITAMKYTEDILLPDFNFTGTV